MFLDILVTAPSRAADETTTLNLHSQELGGDSAISAMGGNLPAVAAQYGKTANQLRSLLRRDRTLRVDRHGKLLYKEEMPKLPRQAPGASAQSGVLDGALFPLDQTFRLHSKPGSNRLLILNFQGKTITGTYWNTSLGKPSIVAPPFNVDGNAAVFSNAERTTIQQIWQIVAEDYSPFDVDVTTDTAAISSAPAGSQFATAVITTRATFSTSSPGMAYTSTFNNPTYDPAFVAYDSLGGNAKYIAEAVSHEFGHRLGLDHDGQGIRAYYDGQGTAPMRWAPIMGNSYRANITQFSMGEYAGANNLQDDFLVMQRYLAYRADNAGNIPGQATDFPGATNGATTSGTADGIIERQNDADLFTLRAGAGPLSASVATAAAGGNVDIVLSLLDGNGNELVSANPAVGLNASLSYTIASAGTYYLRIRPTGYLNPLNTGYSAYGNRGNYRLTANYPATVAAPPRAVISAAPAGGLAPLTVQFSAAGSSPAAAITGYGWNFANGTMGKASTGTATYSQPGRYTVQLRVTGNNGFANTTAKEVVVGRPFTATLTLNRIANPDGSFSASANLNSFRDEAGRFLSPLVAGTWSGAVQASQSVGGLTRRGITFTSPSTRNASACFTFTVNSITASNPDPKLKLTDASPSTAETYFPARPLTATTCPQQAVK